MELRGSKTEKNLMEAFAGESQARNKYTYYASQAKKDGYVQISKIFEETANNEKEHAKIWFKLLHDGAVPDTIKKISALFELVGKIEKEHEERYRKLLAAVKNGTVFEKTEKVVWECSNCGHTYESETALELCPVCKHPKSYFYIKAQNY